MREDRNYVFRGGSWYNTPPYVGAAATAEGYPGRAVVNIGFRLVHDSADRVYRGGSWRNSAQDARVANRDWDDPADRLNDLGFRLTRETR
jgi:formylglycine-generating enzyme required for sulfatase activity